MTELREELQPGLVDQIPIQSTGFGSAIGRSAAYHPRAGIVYLSTNRAIQAVSLDRHTAEIGPDNLFFNTDAAGSFVFDPGLEFLAVHPNGRKLYYLRDGVAIYSPADGVRTGTIPYPSVSFHGGMSIFVGERSTDGKIERR